MKQLKVLKQLKVNILKDLKKIIQLKRVSLESFLFLFVKGLNTLKDLVKLIYLEMAILINKSFLMLFQRLKNGRVQLQTPKKNSIKWIKIMKGQLHLMNFVIGQSKET